MAANQQPRKTGSDGQQEGDSRRGRLHRRPRRGRGHHELHRRPRAARRSPTPRRRSPADSRQGPDRIKLQRDIAQAEEILRKDPQNYQAWVQIGNDYFDLGEAQKSVDAYQRALAIKGDDPNVLTDMGVMYRQLKDFPKAVAAFRKAMAVARTTRRAA